MILGDNLEKTYRRLPSHQELIKKVQISPGQLDFWIIIKHFYQHTYKLESKNFVCFFLLTIMDFQKCLKSKFF